MDSKNFSELTNLKLTQIYRFRLISRRAFSSPGISMLRVENNFRGLHSDAGQKQSSRPRVEHSLHIMR